MCMPIVETPSEMYTFRCLCMEGEGDASFLHCPSFLIETPIEVGIARLSYYHTTYRIHCLSHDQQLFRSASVHDHVVCFVTSVGNLLPFRIIRAGSNVRCAQ